MFPGIHDSLLVAYSVDSEHQALVLSLLPHHGSALAPFAVVFSGVVAHSFPAPLLPAILGDIRQTPADALLRQEWASIERAYRANGWPGPWANSLLDAMAFVTASELRGYEIESSYGLNGWVLARDARMVEAA